jgi:hypothetical protein
MAGGFWRQIYVLNIGGENQFACGQVSRSINVTDKPQERGEECRGWGWGGDGKKVVRWCKKNNPKYRK